MMKVRALVLDLTGNAMEWLNSHGNEEHLEICEVITFDDDSPIPIWDLNKYDCWDYLLVFENGVTDKVKQILNHAGISDERIIFPLDNAENSMYDKRAVTTYIFDENMKLILDYISHRKSGEKYTMITVEDLAYVNVSTDNVILPEMILTGRNWAYKEMKLFYALASKYFKFDDKQNIFCDIGANIGTTCIYFKKKLDPDVRIMSFEPSLENYKLLRINALLNDIDVSLHGFHNLGLSDKTGKASISYNLNNPGGSTLISGHKGKTEDICLVSFDDFLGKNGIGPEEIKYLWVDVEGYEGRFLAGAGKTLEKMNAPVFMEFIPRLYSGRKDEFELYINELEKNFGYYICADFPDAGKQPVSNLKNVKDNIELSWDLFLLKE